MRKIKFRAWDKKRKFMLTIFDSTTAKEWFLPNLNEDYEVMQYTGVNDIYGNEIYEGDIIYLRRSFFGFELKPEKFLVRFKYGNFVLENELSIIFDLKGYKPLGWCERVEVIGNIYEIKEDEE